MALTLAQIDSAIDAAFAAYTLGELSYTIKGRTVSFRSITELDNHIDWLEKKKAELTAQSEINAGTSQAGLVRFQEAS